jgi:type 1 glutamine amidotransferase
MRSALIVYGGWDGHDPEECASIYRRWLHEDGFSVRMATETSAFADPSIHDLSLIIPIFTMSTIAKEEAQNLSKAIESGVGLAGHHGGMGDAFREAVDYQFMCGGQWVAHPGGIIDYTVDITRPDDPLMQGIASFEHRSEQYYMHVDPAERGAGNHDFQRRARALDRRGGDAGGLAQALRRRAGIPHDAGASRQGVREPQHGDHPAARHELGGPRGLTIKLM